MEPVRSHCVSALAQGRFLEIAKRLAPEMEGMRQGSVSAPSDPRVTTVRQSDALREKHFARPFLRKAGIGIFSTPMPVRGVENEK